MGFTEDQISVLEKKSVLLSGKRGHLSSEDVEGVLREMRGRGGGGEVVGRNGQVRRKGGRGERKAGILKIIFLLVY